jgi:hypothetical protein
MKMNNLPKYMLLTHPTISGEFIVRTQPPIIIGQVVRGDIEQMIRDYKPMAVGKPYEQNEWAVFFAGKLDAAPLTGTVQEQADQLAKIMRKMSDFYLNQIAK